jgi:hypothetical protein
MWASRGVLRAGSRTLLTLPGARGLKWTAAGPGRYRGVGLIVLALSRPLMSNDPRYAWWRDHGC